MGQNFTDVEPNSIVLSAQFKNATISNTGINLYDGGSGTEKTINYADIVTKDQLPTKTSQLTNDSGYQKASDVSTAVSTAISGQTKEEWHFVLADGTVVIKYVVLG